MPPPVFPTIPGMSIELIKTSKWSNGRAVSASGRAVRVAFWSYPMWTWELNFEFLRDAPTPSELQLLLGFFNSVYGGLLDFQFEDPDDNTVTGQIIGTGDGVTTSFVIVRTYGGASGSGTEPIGYVKDGTTTNVYLDGVLQTTGVSINTTNPVAQLVVFTSPPADGVVVTVDVQYLFYVHFLEDFADFDRFLWQYYAVRKLTLESQRR